MMLIGTYTGKVLEQAARSRRAGCDVELPKLTATEMRRSHEIVMKVLFGGRMRRWAR